MRIMGHKTDAMDIRYGVVEDGDILDAGAKLEETFRSVMGNDEDVPGSHGTSPALDPAVVAKLSTLSGDKVKALLALLSD